VAGRSSGQVEILDTENPQGRLRPRNRTPKMVEMWWPCKADEICGGPDILHVVADMVAGSRVNGIDMGAGAICLEV